MIEIKLGKAAVRLDFSFFAVIALFLLTDKTDFGITALCACAAHELSHLIVMRICGAEVTSITFYGAGIRISSENTESLKPSAQAAIYAAGCVMNFLIAMTLWLLGYREASVINLFTGIFNLLPLGALDGARLLKLLLIRVCRPECVDTIIRRAAIASAVIIAAAAVLLGGGISFTLITTALYFVIACSQNM